MTDTRTGPPVPAVVAGVLGVLSAVLTEFQALFGVAISAWAGGSWGAVPVWQYVLLGWAPVQLWAAVRLLRRRGWLPVVLTNAPGALLTFAGVVADGVGAGGLYLLPQLSWPAVPVVVLGLLPGVRQWATGVAAGPVGVRRTPPAMVTALVLAGVSAAAPAYLAGGLVLRPWALVQPSGLLFYGPPLIAAALVITASVRLLRRGGVGLMIVALTLTAVVVVVATPGGDWSWRGLLCCSCLLAGLAALAPQVRQWTGSR
ncbi:hypothetical protein [Goekera deserti]|uniref:hypothetical protein n=1 Tax=Goekera deserti TaxID=2497753 RepID=UPI00192E76B2|nr:hypothetical protein [Goekera deserti]